jgi:hypothetical protein
MAKAPAYVREFLRTVPAIWDDVEFLDGYPGRFAVLARRSGNRWYVAGINAEKTAREVVVEIPGVKARGATLIADDVEDGGNMSFHKERVQIGDEQPLSTTIQPMGGFVMTVDRAL